MGRGDYKTKKGKRYIKSFGITRKRPGKERREKGESTLDWQDPVDEDDDLTDEEAHEMFLSALDLGLERGDLHMRSKEVATKLEDDGDGDWKIGLRIDPDEAEIQKILAGIADDEDYPYGEMAEDYYKHYDLAERSPGEIIEERR
jgi:ribosomal small subunit protein bTHX